MTTTAPDATITVKATHLVISGPAFDSFRVTPQRAAALLKSVQDKPFPLGHFLWNIEEGCFRSYDARAIRNALIRHFKARASKKSRTTRSAVAA